jgi:hypothetical protein
MELKGKTPSEAAKINIKLERNKLLGIIHFASMPKT